MITACREEGETMTLQLVFEGTWEELVQHADQLAGKRLRVEVLGSGRPITAGKIPFYASATPEERARAYREWAESHSRDTPLLSDAAISRESIYSDDRS
jgi:hypothetical protein